MRDHAFTRHDCLQRRDDLGAPRQHGLIRFGHLHGHRVTKVLISQSRRERLSVARI
jgi:hypothetical protein